MSAGESGVDPRSRAVLASRIVGAVLVVVGLGVAAWGAWSIASAVGPTSTSPGQVTDLTKISDRYSTSYIVDIASEGGRGSIDSTDLYAALYPLDGQPAVLVEHSAITGAAVEVELDGVWYKDAGLSLPLDVALGVAGLLMVGAGGFVLFRGARATAATARGRLSRGLPVVLAAVGVGLGLMMLAYGAEGLVVLVGPRTTVTATVVGTAYSYVDLAWNGETRRVISADLARDVSIDQRIAAGFGRSSGQAVSVELSAADGSPLRVQLDGTWYDVGPSPVNALVPFAAGLLFLGVLSSLGVRARRQARSDAAQGATSGTSPPVR